MSRGGTPFELLRLLQSFSGVAVILTLLISLPWLPIDAPSTAERQQLAAAAIVLPSVRPTPRPYQDLTFFIVGTQDDYHIWQAVYPDSTSSKMFMVPPEDQKEFDGFRLGLDANRDQKSLPEIRVIDLR